MSTPRKPLPDDVPEGLKPRLRLFLSVDLVGATQFKQSRHAWRSEILSFYRNFDYVLHSQTQKFRESLDSPLPAPEFWKSNGDELLYTWGLQNLADAHSILHIWLAALAEYRAMGSDGGQQLHLKSTAWIALFPLPNSEVFFRRGATPSRSHTVDLHDAALLQSEIRDEWYADGATGEITKEYVGPSIDTGFRLTSWATPERLIISVDLAFLLTSSHPQGVDPLPIRMGGKEPLKGVIDNAPYPVIWIAASDADTGRDRQRGETTANASVIKSTCEAIIEQNYKFITPIFMTVASHDDYEWAPPYILRQIAQHWREEVRYKADRLAGAQPQMAE